MSGPANGVHDLIMRLMQEGGHRLNARPSAGARQYMRERTFPDQFGPGPPPDNALPFPEQPPPISRDPWFDEVSADTKTNPFQQGIDEQKGDIAAAREAFNTFAISPKWNMRQLELHVNNLDKTRQLELADMMGFNIQSYNDLPTVLPEIVNLLALSTRYL